MYKTKYSIIITAFNEASTITKAISQILKNDKNILNESEIIVVAPDNATLDMAKKSFKRSNNFKLIKDEGKGKCLAINLALKHAKGSTLIFTDGDMYIDSNALKNLLSKLTQNTVAVSANPRPINKRFNMFGFYANLFCDAADKNRSNAKIFVPLSGYLFAVKNIDNLFPLPSGLKSEDAYISYKLKLSGKHIGYAKNAYAFVKFPTNTHDWLLQKERSLGGNYELKKYFKTLKTRNIYEDLNDALYTLFYIRNFKEFIYLLYLYPLRLYLWVKIITAYSPQDSRKGTWARIESTKNLRQ